MIGTLSRSAADGGGRRVRVDALLSRVARDAGADFIGAGGWLTDYHAVPLLADRVHLQPAGHRLFRDVLGSSMRALGLALPPPAQANAAE